MSMRLSEEKKEKQALRRNKLIKNIAFLNGYLDFPWLISLICINLQAGFKQGYTKAQGGAIV